MIDAHDVRLAEHIIDTSGAVDILLAGRQRDKRGRKSDPMNYRLFLVGGLLNVMTQGNFVIEDVHVTLTKRLCLDDQFHLGVRRWKVERKGENRKKMDVITVHDLYNVSKTLNEGLRYGDGSAKDIDVGERARRHSVITDYCDALMDVFDLDFKSRSYAIDATGIWSWGKGSHRKGSEDGDAQTEPDNSDVKAEVAPARR